jgi:hypothetical protein
MTFPQSNASKYMPQNELTDTPLKSPLFRSATEIYVGKLMQLHLQLKTTERYVADQDTVKHIRYQCTSAGAWWLREYRRPYVLKFMQKLCNSKRCVTGDRRAETAKIKTLIARDMLSCSHQCHTLPFRH